MELTREEEAILNGEHGEAKALALEMIVRVGEVLGARRLVRITHAHASGVSYGTIGDPGLHWLEELVAKGAKVSVYSTVNPIGMDIVHDTIKVGEEFKEKQLKILNAFKAMGFDVTLTCTPYYIRKPSPFERLAWGESSAVIYANSVLGAFTNREGGPLAVAAAVVGRTYEAGLQILENRKTTHLVKLNFEPNDLSEWSAVGYLVGEKIGQGIPRYEVRIDDVQAKYMLAASAASGGIAMSVIDGLTPRGTYIIGEEERIEIEKKEVEEMFGAPEDADIVFHGCPHVSVSELKELLNRRPKKETWIAVAPRIYEKHKDLMEKLKGRGYVPVVGTCSVVSPIERMGIKRVATTSAKTYFYLKKRGLDVWLVKFSEV